MAASSDLVDPFGSGSLFDEFDRERRETAPYLLGNDDGANSNNEESAPRVTQQGRHTFFLSSSSETDDDDDNDECAESAENDACDRPTENSLPRPRQTGLTGRKGRTKTKGSHSSSAGLDRSTSIPSNGSTVPQKSSEEEAAERRMECESQETEFGLMEDGMSANDAHGDWSDRSVQDLKERIASLEQSVERLGRESRLIDSTRYQVDESPGIQVIFMNNSFGRKHKADIEQFIAKLVEKEKADPEKLPRVPLLPSSVCLAEKRKDMMDSSTYDCVWEQHTVLGCCQFYNEYIQDPTGWPLVNHTPALTDGWEFPVYDQIFTDSLPVVEAEGDKPAQKQKRMMNKPVCFNCRGDHTLRECKEKRDYAKIQANKAEFLGKSQNSQSSSKSRYHIEDDPRFANYKAGVISDKLREAMGLREDQLPPYIYQMRVHGFPPGHLFDAKVEGSGICLFDRDGREVSNEGESLEEGEVNVTTVQDTYDLNKIVEYPGFNMPVPNGVYDDHRRYNFPPMQEFQLKARLEEIMGSNVFKRQVEQEGGGRKKKMKIDSAGREEIDMDLDSGEEDDNSIKIAVKITNKHLAKIDSDSVSTSLQSSRNASSVSLDELEHQRELILKQMEDEEDTQPVDDMGSQEEGTDSDVPQMQSTPQRSNTETSQVSNSSQLLTTPRSISISKEFGTPIGVDSAQPLPDPEKFSRDITEHIPYENLPNATGMFEKMQSVMKNVRDKYKTLFS